MQFPSPFTMLPISLALSFHNQTLRLSMHWLEQQFYVWLWYQSIYTYNCIWIKGCECEGMLNKCAFYEAILCRFYDFQTFLSVLSIHFNWCDDDEILCHFQKLIKASCWWPFKHSHTLHHYYYYDINNHKSISTSFPSPPFYLSPHHHNASASLRFLIFFFFFKK